MIKQSPVFGAKIFPPSRLSANNALNVPTILFVPPLKQQSGPINASVYPIYFRFLIFAAINKTDKGKEILSSYPEKYY